MDKGSHDSIQLSHIGSFLLLFTFAILRPEGVFPGTALPVGPLCLLAAIVILPWKVHCTLGFTSFWKQYRQALVLLSVYQLLCVLSLLSNMDRYHGLAEFFRWGVVFIAGQMLVPLCIFIFLMPGTPRKLNRPVSFITLAVAGFGIILIPASVLIQVYLPEVAALSMKYFVGGDIADVKSPIRGILATSTDLGAISAILCWASLSLAFQNGQNTSKTAVFLVLCSLLFAVAGLLSGSRNFILFMLVAIVTALVARLWVRNKVLLASTLLSLGGLFFALAYTFPPRLLNKLGKFFPYFEKVRIGKEISLKDLLPNNSLESLGPRKSLWESAIKLIAENPSLGISNGGFRLAADCSCQQGNTHNILLQSAIDAGILGFVVMSLLLGNLIRHNAHSTGALALVLGIGATLMVDNFTDHSFAWIVVASYTGVVVFRSYQKRPTGIH